MEWIKGLYLFIYNCASMFSRAIIAVTVLYVLGTLPTAQIESSAMIIISIMFMIWITYPVYQFFKNTFGEKE